MQEREVITLGFGNYSSLVAAQWVNGTSRYDVNHSTLYHERHLQSVLGGQCLYSVDDNNSNEQTGTRGAVGTNGIVRVPRLLLLDAPHASYFTQLTHQAFAEDNDNNCDEGEHGKDGICYSNRDKERVAHIHTLVRQAKRQWWSGKQSTFNQQNKDSDEDGSYDKDKSQQDDNDDKKYANRHNYHVDPTYNTKLQQQEEKQLQNAPESKQINTIQDKNHKKYKRLFQTHDTVVPWWRYITTGLDVHAVTLLRPLHNTIDNGSEMASLHSVGYGLSHFTANNSHAAQMEQFTDALRHELEQCDHVQGLQCFVDSDSCFAGAASNVRTEIAQDVGSKTPMALFSLFQLSPLMLNSLSQASTSNIPFAQRRVDEMHLNRLLSTAMLSSSATCASQTVYMPFEINHWAEAFEQSGNHQHSNNHEVNDAGYHWLEDDRATAQYIAAVCDSALYGLRDGNASHTDKSSPAYYMSEWTQTLRVNPSMRLSAVAGALPLRSTCNSSYSLSHNSCSHMQQMQNSQLDLWTFLQHHALLPRTQTKSRNTTYNSQWQREQFVPLTHSMNFSPHTEAGRVLGHTFALRGVGALPCTRYPRDEALARYAFPLSTSTYLPLLTASGYPVSCTFPHELLKLYTQHNLQHKCVSSKNNNTTNSSGQCATSTINVGAHVCTTYGSAHYIEQIAHEAQVVFTRRFHVHKDNYCLQYDEWKEQIEDVWQMHDDYKHGEPENDDNLY